LLFSSMKKILVFISIFLLFCISIFPLRGVSWAIELNTMKPLAPYGIFSAWSAQSLQKGALSFGLSLERSIEPDYYRYLAAASYGLDRRVELTMNLPYFNGRGGEDGLEDLGLALKYRFLEQGRYGPSAALLLMGYLPTGEEGLTRDGAVGAGLLLTKKVGPFLTHLNGIWVTPHKSELKDEWDAIGGLAFPLYHNMEVLGEFEVRKGPFSDSVDLSEGRIGYRLFNDTFFGTLGLGADFKNRSPEYRALFSISTIIPRRGTPAF
jgi:hypothetical protein